MAAWVEPSLHDVMALEGAAQRVVLRKIDGVLTPVIARDWLLRALARLLLARDIVGKLEATSEYDHRPEAHDGRIGFGWGHEAYGVTQPCASYRIEDALSELEAGLLLGTTERLAARAGMVAPSMSGWISRWMCLARAPRGEAAGLGHRQRARVSYTTPAATKAMASRVGDFFLEQNAADATINAGLAADVAASYTAKRAELLAEAERWYPGVYT